MQSDSSGSTSQIDGQKKRQVALLSCKQQQLSDELDAVMTQAKMVLASLPAMLFQQLTKHFSDHCLQLSTWQLQETARAQSDAQAHVAWQHQYRTECTMFHQTLW